MQDLPYSEACERNKEPICEALRTFLPHSGRVLEIGSCTGQHIVFFARAFPGLSWQPSDVASYLPGLRARLAIEGSVAVLAPIELDVMNAWPERDYDGVYSANTAHIMGWPAVQAMFAGVGRVLRPGGVFCLYGPFRHQGGITAPSNEQFDLSLRQRDPSMGLREVAALEKLAAGAHLEPIETLALPANNHLLVFERINGGVA